MSDSAITTGRADIVSLATAKLHSAIDTDLLDSVLRIHLDAAHRYVENALSKLLVAHEREMTLDYFGGDAVEFAGKPFRKLLSIKYVDQSSVERTFDLANIIVGDGRIQLRDGATWPLLDDQVDSVRIRYMAGMALPSSVSGGVWSGVDHGLADGDAVRLWSNGTLPAGFETRDYYVVNATDHTFGLSLTPGGAAVTESDAGSGTHFVGDVPASIQQVILWMVGHFYENREAVTVSGATDNVKALPLGVEAVIFGEASHR